MDFIKTRNKELYAGNTPVLLRGFGLGGWFLPEGYMWKLYKKCDRPRRMEAMLEKLCGKEYAADFWERYLEHYISEKDMDFIASEGFNSIRLPLNARHLYEKRDGQLILNPGMLARIDRLVEWCKCRRLYIILDMHGAPGGQTGQNIDDSESDQPFLFMDPGFEDELVFLWRELAARYCEETIIAGYDLLNEPLPEFFGQYNDKVLPLYRRLIKSIREVDKKHMIILEGVHWATDFSIFDAFTAEEAADNIMLQFHKYWSNPDAESLQKYMEYADRLNVPMFMGEGGENNCDWYTAAFPLYERLNISWSFWSYKKMACTNSPITFDQPSGWPDLIRWIDEGKDLTSERAATIFDDFINCIRNTRINYEVLRALKREVPVKIPGEAYGDYHICSERIPGVKLRESEPVSLIFEDGRTGEVDYRRYGGEAQQGGDNILVQLFPGDGVGYSFYSGQETVKIAIRAAGKGTLLLTAGSEEKRIDMEEMQEYYTEIKCTPYVKQSLWLTCVSGNVKVDYIYLYK